VKMTSIFFMVEFPGSSFDGLRTNGPVSVVHPFVVSLSNHERIMVYFFSAYSG